MTLLTIMPRPVSGSGSSGLGARRSAFAFFVATLSLLAPVVSGQGDTAPPTDVPEVGAPTVSPAGASPTKSPVAATKSPVTAMPTKSPVTAMPTAKPTKAPTKAPTTEMPTATPTEAGMRTVNYVDPYDGTELMGYYFVPGLNVKRPIVVVFPDWDGVNEYEQMRAEMFAELGYVGFAADIFGVENHQPETREERMALTEIYRNDPDLYNARITAAISRASQIAAANPNKGVAIVGYCFGGTGTINYALSGMAVTAAVAFHGSLSNAAVELNEAVKAKVLILSGGEDDQDSTADIIAMEDALNAGGELWEISRYSDVGHGFTNPDHRNYNEYVDGRSWESCVTFLAEAFKDIELVADIPAEVRGQPVDYTDEADGTTLFGYVSYPTNDDGSLSTEPKPAIVIIHDADGIGPYERTRATMIADELGYVGFAADIFGDDHGFNIKNRTDRFALVNLYRNDIDLYVQRMRAAIAAVKADPAVDPTKIALIGYCFGGTGVINYAMVGESEAAAIISFHGGLSTIAPVGEKIYTRMNIQSGGDDDANSAIEDLEEAMKAGMAPAWEYTRYEGVLHAFTNWNREERYNLRADVRSWDSMATFLETTFAMNITMPPTGMPTEMPTTAQTATPTAMPVSSPDEMPVAAPPTDSPTSRAGRRTAFVAGASVFLAALASLYVMV